MAIISLPKDGNAKSIQIVPSVVALAQTYDVTVSASTEITLNTNTSFIEVTAGDEGIMLKWGTSDVTTSNNDEYIAKDTTRQYVVPTDSSTGSLFTAVNFIERVASAFLVVVEK